MMKRIKKAMAVVTAVVLTAGYIYMPVLAAENEQVDTVSAGTIAEDVVADEIAEVEAVFEDEACDEPAAEDSADEAVSEDGIIPEEGIISEETEDSVSADEAADEGAADTDLNPDGYFILTGTKITGLTDAGKNATEFVIPEGITAIVPSACQNQKKLTKVTLPASLKELGGGAFVNCSSLSTLVIKSKSFEVTGDHAFRGCALTSVTLPEAMTAIPAMLFCQATFVNYDLVIAKNITKIEADAFWDAKGIRSISFEDESALQSVGENAFSGLTVGSITLPDSLKSIKGSAFKGMDLTEITIPKNVEYVEGQAFGNNPLKKVVIKSTKLVNKNMGGTVQGGILAIDTSVGKSERLEKYGNGIETIILPEGLKSIPTELFRLTYFHDAEIVIPASVTSIGANSFGNLIGTVKSFTFERGSKLTSIGWNGFMFNGVPNNKVTTKFYVESESYAEKWLKEAGFTNICSSVNLAKTTVKLLFAGKEGTSTEYTGAAIEPDVVVSKGSAVVDPSHYDVAYKNNKDAGTATVIITAKDDDEECSGRKEVYFTIVGNSLSDSKKFAVECPAHVAWKGPSYETKAEVKVKRIKDGTYLTKDTDYFLHYTGAGKPGKVTVTVVGIGGYEGSRSVSYTIDKPDLKDAADSGKDGLVCFGPHSDDGFRVYDTKAQKPEVILSYNGIRLAEGTDYTVTYKNNINAYTLSPFDAGFSAKKAPVCIVTGKGNFKGTKSFYFEINPLKLVSGNTLITIPSQKYTGRALTPAPSVKVTFDNGVTKVLKAGKDYKKPAASDYRNNVETSAGKIEAYQPAVTLATLTGSNYLAEGMTGYFDIADAANNIADNKDFALGSVTGKDFTGSAIELTDEEVSTLLGKRKSRGSSDIDHYLIKDSDYRISYRNNINAGKATAVISGMGSFYGTRTVSFSIRKKAVNDTTELSKFEITLDGKADMPSYFYTGYAVKPAVKVVDPMGSGTEDDVILRPGKDYSVRYANNTNVTTDSKKASVTITFKGNYAGNKRAGTDKVSKHFEIKPTDLASDQVEISRFPDTSSFMYNNGKTIKQKVKVAVRGSGGAYIAQVNPKAYKVSFSDTRKPGSFTITVSSAKKGSVLNSKTLDGTITPGLISSASISALKPQVYKGRPITPKVKVKYRGKVLKENKDYTLSYENNDTKGVATVKVKAAAGSYFMGSNSINFLIK